MVTHRQLKQRVGSGWSRFSAVMRCLLANGANVVVLVGGLFCFSSSVALAQPDENRSPSGLKCPAYTREQPKPLEGESRSATYRSTGGQDLLLHIFDPPDRRPSAKRAALLLFHGGGWSRGNPREFEPHAKYFAQQGMVAIVVNYRLACRDGTGVDEAISDAKAAIRWVRTNSAKLGIDLERLVAGGGSAGGHIALSAAVFADSEDRSENNRVSSVPNALLLFSTPVDITTSAIRSVTGLNQARSAARSPLYHVRRGLPPTLFLQGKDDDLVAFSTVEDYCVKARLLGDQCTVIGYDKAAHGFFNFKGRGSSSTPDNAKKRKGGDLYREALSDADRFLRGLGYMPKP